MASPRTGATSVQGKFYEQTGRAQVGQRRAGGRGAVATFVAPRRRRG